MTKLDMNAAMAFITMASKVLSVRLLSLVGIAGAIGLTYWAMVVGSWQSVVIGCVYDAAVLLPIFNAGDNSGKET